MTPITMKEVAAFLLGEASLDGYWFGERHPISPFWWRERLRAAQPATAPEQKPLVVMWAMYFRGYPEEPECKPAFMEDWRVYSDAASWDAEIDRANRNYQNHDNPTPGWLPYEARPVYVYAEAQPERKHTDADLAAEYERGRKAGLTQAYDAALAQQERQSHTPETVRKIIEDDRAQRGEPVAWRAWFDKDSGARWLFSLWPDEENKGLEVDWQPLYTAPQPERKPMTDMEIQEAWNDHYLEHDMNEFDYYRMGQSDAERHHGIKP